MNKNVCIKRIVTILVIIVFISTIGTACSKEDASSDNDAEQTTSQIGDDVSEKMESKKGIEEAEPETEERIENPDIRNLRWGMSREEVEKIEGRPDEKGDNYIGYYDLSVAGLDVLMACSFNEDDQLYDLMYILDEMHTNKNDYISDYDTLVSSLTEKYGEPNSSNIFWKDDLYKDDPYDWGMAIAVGDMTQGALWETERTDILIYITGDNYDISVGLGYTSKTVEAPEIDNTEGL